MFYFIYCNRDNIIRVKNDCDYCDEGLRSLSEITFFSCSILFISCKATAITILNLHKIVT